MRMRLAMANDREEMSVTLDAKVTPEEAVMQMGVVRRRKMVTRTNPEGETVREAVLELDKVVYLSDSCRERVARKAMALRRRGRPHHRGRQPAVHGGLGGGGGI